MHNESDREAYLRRKSSQLRCSQAMVMVDEFLFALKNINEYTGFNRSESDTANKIVETIREAIGRFEEDENKKHEMVSKEIEDKLISGNFYGYLSSYFWRQR